MADSESSSVTQSVGQRINQVEDSSVGNLGANVADIAGVQDMSHKTMRT
jgi:hypothetical protein